MIFPAWNIDGNIGGNIGFSAETLHVRTNKHK
jgi:hypothetical protein